MTSLALSRFDDQCKQRCFLRAKFQTEAIMQTGKECAAPLCKNIRMSIPIKWGPPGISFQARNRPGEGYGYKIWKGWIPSQKDCIRQSLRTDSVVCTSRPMPFNWSQEWVSQKGSCWLIPRYQHCLSLILVPEIRSSRHAQHWSRGYQNVRACVKKWMNDWRHILGLWLVVGQGIMIRPLVGPHVLATSTVK
jgi:hypothetical protein